MPHLDPVPLANVQEDDIRERFEHYRKTRGFTPNSIMTMVRRPNIVRAFMALNQAVLYEGTVPEETKMLVSLASSYAAGCRYCQSHMANLSSIYKASDEKIAALWNFEKSDLFSDAERAALSLALKAGAQPNTASQEDFDELAKHYDEGQIVEIVAAISLFGYLNRWNDTMATSLEQLPAQLAGRALGAAGWDAGKHTA
ncbi:MAG: carboxymuconolactone decarboxylase family protein [Gammaproteobacteria bacterium]|nr:carboxymuconolactone decarboxylase family protein [Gammaproteobacteria bacterium]MBU1439722.1 carboxymuconolactone decarboxylase family protein [Gammaproteobacteria bacterium]MBU2285601.1 carboxymuconolactone decarboxylase family protein [Gammaproteobacteria bacterium]MBU2410159.1 carboxymuconolactone decarboxylase family protein [Gammaproteobacteria bacterium]